MSQPGKPTVAIFTLGGTIAMLQTPDGGVAPALSASDLLAAVPGLERIEAQLEVHDVLNKPGASLTLADICLGSITVLARINKLVLPPLPTIDAIMARCEAMEAFAKADPLKQVGAPKG